MLQSFGQVIATAAVVGLGLYYVFPAWDRLVCAHYARDPKLPIWPLVGIGAGVTFALGAIWS
jgi:hypothetical protein